MVNATNDGSEENPNSHFLDVPAGCSHITDVMITSPIVQPPDMGMGAAEAGGANGEPGAAGGEVDPLVAMGIDPNLDPELAMAIRLSMEEAKAAEQAANPQPEAQSEPA